MKKIIVQKKNLTAVFSKEKSGGIYFIQGECKSQFHLEKIVLYFFESKNFFAANILKFFQFQNFYKKNLKIFKSLELAVFSNFKHSTSPIIHIKGNLIAGASEPLTMASRVYQVFLKCANLADENIELLFGGTEFSSAFIFYSKNFSVDFSKLQKTCFNPATPTLKNYGGYL